MRRHVAYLRLSVDDKSKDPEDERAVQTATVRRLAGTAPLEIVDGDWGISGSHEALPKRRAFIALTAAVVRGEVEAVYASRLDRLSRDQRDMEDFAYACRDHGTRLITNDGEVMTVTANQEFHLGVQALVNQHEHKLIRERIRAGVAEWVGRGNAPGSAPYGMRFIRDAEGLRVLAANPDEDVDVLLNAVREGGSFHAGARLLNARGVPTRRGRQWVGPVVYKILAKQRPDAVDVRRPRGPIASKLLGRGIFRRLLRCYCSAGAEGHWLTPKPQRAEAAPRRERVLMSYICTYARTDPNHPRPAEVSELRLMKWAREAVGWTVTNTYTDEVAPVDLAAFDERRKRAAVAFTMGAMTREELASVQRDLAEAQNAATAARKVKSLRIANFDWDRPDAEVNADLRSLWREVKCHPGMREFDAIPWTADVPSVLTAPGASVGEFSRALAAAQSGPRPKVSPDWAPADDLPF
jgi:DNA invertase Pin-like site-specific DNA recombinase